MRGSGRRVTGLPRGSGLPPPPRCISYTKVPNQYGPYAYCSLDTGVACARHIQLPTPGTQVKKERIAWRAGASKGNMMHKDTKNQSYVGSSGQTLTTNASTRKFVTKPMSYVAALCLVPNQNQVPN